MYTCVAPNCKNRNGKNCELTFHRFPRNKELKDKWLEALNKPLDYVNKASVLCSAHFEPQCYGGVISPKWLKNDAVPTIFNFDQIPPENNSAVMERMTEENITHEPEIDKINNEMEVDQSNDKMKGLLEMQKQGLDFNILKITKKTSRPKRKQILIPREVWDKIRASGCSEIIQSIISEPSRTSATAVCSSKTSQLASEPSEIIQSIMVSEPSTTSTTSVCTSKTLEPSEPCNNSSTATEAIIEVSDINDPVTDDCIIIEEDSSVIDITCAQENTDFNLKQMEGIVNVGSSSNNLLDKYIFRRKINRGRPPKKPKSNLVEQNTNIGSLLKRRNACIQVFPSRKDIFTQTDLYEEANYAFKNRILNSTIDVLQKRIYKLEAKQKAQSGALWMKNKKLAVLKEQKKELCEKLNDKSMNVIQSALKEVLKEYFKNSTSLEDAVNKSQQLSLHANISFKRKQ